MSSFIPFEDFDPNDLVGNDALWGVYADNGFKIYTKRAPALGRFGAWPRAKLYTYDGSVGRWVLIAVKDLKAKNGLCDICGGPTDKSIDPHAWYPAGRFCWDRKGNGKLADPLTLYYACHDCRDARGL